MATYSISAVMIPARANSSWVTIWPGRRLADGPLGGAGGHELVGGREAVVLGLDRARRAPRRRRAGDPGVAHAGQAGLDVDAGVGSV